MQHPHGGGTSAPHAWPRSARGSASSRRAAPCRRPPAIPGPPSRSQAVPPIFPPSPPPPSHFCRLFLLPPPAPRGPGWAPPCATRSPHSGVSPLPHGHRGAHGHGDPRAPPRLTHLRRTPLRAGLRRRSAAPNRSAPRRAAPHRPGPPPAPPHGGGDTRGSRAPQPHTRPRGGAEMRGPPPGSPGCGARPCALRPVAKGRAAGGCGRLSPLAPAPGGDLFFFFSLHSSH